jgi:Domain of unknown function (DUF4381)
MSADPASLDRLHDIVVPDPTPWWPPAPGWLWLAGLVLALLTLATLAAFIRWQKNRYRREALAELERLAAAASPAASGGLSSALSELLKRTALTAYPREDVATLTGPRWFAFLDSTGGTTFSAGLGAAMERATYLASSAEPPYARDLELVREVRTWIRRHKPLPDIVRAAQDSDSPSRPHARAPEAVRP